MSNFTIMETKLLQVLLREMKHDYERNNAVIKALGGETGGADYTDILSSDELLSALGITCEIDEIHEVIYDYVASRQTNQMAVIKYLNRHYDCIDAEDYEDNHARYLKEIGRDSE